MQTSSARFWIRFTVFISYEENQYGQNATHDYIILTNFSYQMMTICL